MREAVRSKTVKRIPDEFQFLASDAKRVGRVEPLPHVARFSEHLGGDAQISGLQFGTEPAEIVFLHGAGLNAHTFDPTILALHHPAISLDLPGHGQSTWRQDAQYVPEVLAHDVWTALSQRSPLPRIIVGQSLGGLTALAFAASHPDQLSHVIIVDITPGVTPDDGGASIREFIAGQTSFANVDEIIDRAIAYRIGSDREALRRGITLNTRLRSDGRLEWTHHLAHVMTHDPEDGVLMGDDSFDSLWESARTFLGSGGALTLIRGSQGIVSDEQLTEWRSLGGNARDFTLEAGHNVQEHAPRELAELIVQISKL